MHRRRKEYGGLAVVRRRDYFSGSTPLTRTANTLLPPLSAPAHSTAVVACSTDLIIPIYTARSRPALFAHAARSPHRYRTVSTGGPAWVHEHSHLPIYLPDFSGTEWDLLHALRPQAYVSRRGLRDCQPERLVQYDNCAIIKFSRVADDRGTMPASSASIILHDKRFDLPSPPYLRTCDLIASSLSVVHNVCNSTEMKRLLTATSSTAVKNKM